MAKGEFSLYYLHHIAPVAKNNHSQLEAFHNRKHSHIISESFDCYITENKGTRYINYSFSEQKRSQS